MMLEAPGSFARASGAFSNILLLPTRLPVWRLRSTQNPVGGNCFGEGLRLLLVLVFICSPMHIVSFRNTASNFTRRSWLKLSAGATLALGLWPGCARWKDNSRGGAFRFAVLNAGSSRFPSKLPRNRPGIAVDSRPRFGILCNPNSGDELLWRN